MNIHADIVRRIQKHFRDNPPVKYGTDTPLYPRRPVSEIIQDAQRREEQARGGQRTPSRDE